MTMSAIHSASPHAIDTPGHIGKTWNVGLPSKTNKLMMGLLWLVFLSANSALADSLLWRHPYFPGDSFRRGGICTSVSRTVDTRAPINPHSRRHPPISEYSVR